MNITEALEKLHEEDGVEESYEEYYVIDDIYFSGDMNSEWDDDIIDYFWDVADMENKFTEFRDCFNVACKISDTIAGDEKFRKMVKKALIRICEEYEQSPEELEISLDICIAHAGYNIIKDTETGETTEDLDYSEVEDWVSVLTTDELIELLEEEDLVDIDLEEN